MYISCNTALDLAGVIHSSLDTIQGLFAVCCRSSARNVAGCLARDADGSSKGYVWSMYSLWDEIMCHTGAFTVLISGFLFVCLQTLIKILTKGAACFGNTSTS